MKKMMKIIKSNSFISKAIAVLTIFMVLLSSLTISSFAADDEVSAANEATDSITDTWTSVMNWITSSLSSAQGVFFGSSSSTNSIVLNSSDLSVTTSPDTLYYIYLPDLDYSTAVSGQTYTFIFSGISYDLVFDSSSNGLMFTGDILVACPYDEENIFGVQPNTWVLFLDEPFSGTVTLTSPFPFVSGSQLTFLGTLAVIGVAIAIAFLLISVISRFLRLRG